MPGNLLATSSNVLRIPVWCNTYLYYIYALLYSTRHGILDPDAPTKEPRMKTETLVSINAQAFRFVEAMGITRLEALAYILELESAA